MFELETQTLEGHAYARIKNPLLLSSVQRTEYPLLGRNTNDDEMFKFSLVSRILNPHALKKSVISSLHVIWKLYRKTRIVWQIITLRVCGILHARNEQNIMQRKILI